MTPLIERLVIQLSKLPGVGTRTARRYALALVAEPEARIMPLVQVLQNVAQTVCICSACGNVDEQDPCHICDDINRDTRTVLVVERVADLWAMERASIHNGLYHVLGGTLSALGGIGPDSLYIKALPSRLTELGATEVILALSATVEGQTTAHYITDLLLPLDIKISKLGQGLPMGGALDYLDDGTLAAAFQSRRAADD